MKNSNVLYLSHGGGPLPLLGDRHHDEMVACLKDIAAKIPKPSAIIVISAHWEAQDVTITSGKNPELIYDYFDFPPESYEIEYPCAGEPALAKQIEAALKKASISPLLDESRGFDHGVFVPLKIMYPEADIPCVQISLLKGLSPSKHIAIGNALQNLDYDNLLVIGSGFSFHNMREFFTPASEQSITQNAAFDEWLVETCCSAELTETERSNRLLNWEQAPHARFCHPREEHLLPLLPCYGLANAKCSEHFGLQILLKKTSMFLWSLAD
ncbi:MAG: DODA-type extradiol aromatic ring-opening family dioxygenase [Desulfovibrio sp.]